MIKAIETFYDGHRFRSRREARTAVFFNSLGVEYEYETEGYELPDGSKYLCDFLVHPGTPRAFWLEVKGVSPTAEELDRAQHLADGTGQTVIVYFGAIKQPGVGLSARFPRGDTIQYLESRALTWHPDPDYGWIEYPDGPYPWELTEPLTGYQLKPRTERFPQGHRRCWHLWWMDCERCGYVILTHFGQQGWCPEIRDDEDPGDTWPNFRHETARLQAAYVAARSARFEHGESGAQ